MNHECNNSSNNNPNNMNMYKENYSLFCSNLNPSLQKELGIQPNKNNILNNAPNDWKAPSTYGLQNSNRVIPEHYFESNNNNNKFKDIDMFYELSKDIRNLHPLTELDYIKTLPKEKILELIDIYNTCLKTIHGFLEDI